MDAVVAIADAPPVRCPECGLATLHSGTHGLCPRCLLGLAVEPEGISPAVLGQPLAGRPDFTLVRELGAGGAGVVYEAIEESTRQTVALKVLRRAAPAAEERFRVEARTAAALTHPNILPVLEVNEADDGLFYAMKFALRGSLAANLAVLRADAPCAAWCRATAALLAPLAHALQHAHERGVIHRDLKPSNILLDASGTPYLADFGLARSLKEDARLTLTDAIIGTPHYMAPEQAAGTREAQTTATDLYSFGAVLYELLTGQPPFPGDNVWEVLRRVRTELPVPPRKRLAGALLSAAFTDLETLSLRCLEKDPARRLASAGELAAELERVALGQRIRSRRVSRAERFARWCRREPVIASLSAALFLGLALASTFFWRHERATHRANQTLELAVLDLSLQHAETLRDRPAEYLSALTALKVPPGAPPVTAAWTRLHLLLEPRLVVESAAEKLPNTAHLLGALTGDRFLFRENATQISVWSARTAARVSSATNFPAPVRDLAFTPGRDPWLALTDDGQLWLGDARGTIRQVPHSLPGPARVALSADGRQAAVFLTAGQLALLELPTGQVRWRGPALGEPVQHFAFSPDGQHLALAAGHGHLLVLRTQDGSPTAPALRREHPLTALAWSPDSQWLACAAADHAIRLRSPVLPPAGSPHRHYQLTEPITSLAFAPGHPGYLLAGTAGKLHYLDTASTIGKPIRNTELHPGTRPAFAPGGDYFAYILPSGHLRTAAAADAGLFWPTQLTPVPLRQLAPAHGTNTLAALAEDGSLYFWKNLPAAAPTYPVPDLVSAQFAGPRLLTIHVGGPVKLWPLPAPGQQTIPTNPPITLPDIAVRAHVNPDATRLLTVTARSVRLWRLDTPGIPALGPAQTFRHGPRHTVFSPDGRRLWAADDGGDTRLLDPADGSVLARWTNATPGELKEVHFASPEVILVTTHTGQLQKLHPATGQLLAARTFFRTPLIALHPDGLHFAATDTPTTVRVFRLADLEPVSPPLEHASTVAFLRFEHDGHHLLTLRANAVHRWHWPDARQITQHHQPGAATRAAMDVRDWPGQPLLAALTQDGQLRLWPRTQSARLSPSIPVSPRHRQIHLSPDHHWLALIRAGQIRLLPAATFTAPVPAGWNEFVRDLAAVRHLPDGTHSPQRVTPLRELRTRYPALLADPNAAWLPTALRSESHP